MTTPKKRRSRCVWTENVDKPRLAKAGSKRHQRFMNGESLARFSLSCVCVCVGARAIVSMRPCF